MYALLYRAIFTHLDAERIHHWAFGLLRLLLGWEPLRRLVRKWLCPDDPRLYVESFGRLFHHPIGLAAGFDKNAEGYEQLAALGFAFIEVGTLTSVAQQGNPKPRLFRLPLDRAVLNRMGFNNEGAEAGARRLDAVHSVPVGVNIGKLKVVDEQDAAQDYATCASIVAAHADYLVINVSSPNTPGLRALQSVEKLAEIIDAIRVRVKRMPPLLVKIAPDLADEDVDAVAEFALKNQLDGIIATNTTISREGLRTPSEQVQQLGAGGISGAPIRDRSLQVLKRLRARVGSQVTLISVGGVDSVDDVWARLRAGASLVQLYTAFIYGGPFFVSRLARGLQKRARKENVRLADIIGADAT